jgi:hypothetical protein
MGSHCNIAARTNHPDVLLKELEGVALVINTLGNSKDEVALLKAQIETTINGDMTIRPSCPCRRTIAPLSSNKVCEYCKEKVSSSTEKEIKPIIFLRRPKGITHLLLPIFTMYFSVAFNHPKFDTFRYLTDPNFKANDQRLMFSKEVIECNIPRGWNNFANNVEAIMLTLQSNVKKFSTCEKVADTIEVFRRYKDLICCRSICFTSNSLFIIEENGTGRWVDAKNIVLHNSISGFSGVDLLATVAERERCLSMNYSILLAHMNALVKKNFKGRNGYFRAGLVAGKGVYICRAVAAGITDPLKYDEVVLPWGIAIAMLRTHIVSKLMRSDPTMTLCEKHNFIRESINTPNEKMRLILTSLLKSANKGRGIGILVQRFPSLQTGSFIMMWFRNFGTNPRDNAAKFPLPSTKSLNADFDGDSFHISLLPTQTLVEGFKTMQYHTNILDPLHPKRLNENVSLTNETYTNCISRNDYYTVNPKEVNDDNEELYARFGVEYAM